ncbi:MAG: hypothetical protein OXC48_11130 [Endozoicomonadaceae bacterium]|nr:hypothetical protein [Endozoicomonadaceae bacterium]
MQNKTYICTIILLFITLNCAGKKSVTDKPLFPLYDDILQLNGCNKGAASHDCLPSKVTFNDFKFDLEDFYYMDYKSSKPQTTNSFSLKKKSAKGLNNVWLMHVKTENINSAEFAGKFEELTGNTSHCIHNYYPKNLRFIVSGTLIVNIMGDMNSGTNLKTLHLDNFVIANGPSNSSDRDTWIGGKNCVRISDGVSGKNVIECTTREQQKLCILKTDSVIQKPSYSINQIFISSGKCK